MNYNEKECIVSDNQSESLNCSITPGKLLAAAREARPFSQEDIAKQMRLSVAAIQDIERDDYTRFAALPFVRGHLRTYAKLVGVSEAHVLEALENSKVMPVMVSATVPRVQGAPVLRMTRHRPQLRHPRLIIAGSIAAVLLLFFITRQSQDDHVNVQSAEVSQSATTVASAEPVATQSITLPTQTVSPAAPIVPTATTATEKNTSTAMHKTVVHKKVWTKKKDIASAFKPTYTLSPAKQS